MPESPALPAWLVELWPRVPAEQQQGLRQIMRGLAQTSAAAPGCPVAESLDGQFLVNGTRKEVTSDKLAMILRAMARRFPGGMRLAELEDAGGLVSGSNYAVNALRKLARDDPDWRAALVFPGGKGKGGYRFKIAR